MVSSREVDLAELVCGLTGKNIRTEFSEFETRLAFQKAVYLLQESGITANKFNFNYYAHGPYSPDWARVGFAVGEGKNLKIKLTKKIDALDSLVAKRKGDVSWLVALATLHWYVTKIRLGRHAALKRAEADGKIALLRNFDEAWDALHSAKWLKST